MNVLLLTLIDFYTLETSNIYTDLMQEFVDQGHNVYIISPTEKRNKHKTQLLIKEKYQILKLKIGNIQKTNTIEKGISTILLDGQFKSGIKKYFSDIKFDLILYSTPPISFSKTIAYIKRKCGAFTYLLLKDIFPQNAVDLGILRRNLLHKFIYMYFRIKEQRLYINSDMIGCMSEENVRYVINHNPQISSEKVELNPNTIKYKPLTMNRTRKEILNEFGVDYTHTVFIYGGNLGKPQGIEFLCQCLKAVDNFNGVTNIIVGSGTEYQKIKSFIEDNGIVNSILVPYLEKDKFDQLLCASDVGLIFLDNRFTIPNYPSRLLSYLQASLPILMSSDSSTDLKNHILDWNIGLWNKSDDLKTFVQNYKSLLIKEIRIELSNNSLKVLKEKFDVSFSFDTIIKHINN